MRWLFNALMDFILVSGADRRPRSSAEIQRELQRIDQILHNLQGCILQIEGKLLTTR